MYVKLFQLTCTLISRKGEQLIVTYDTKLVKQAIAGDKKAFEQILLHEEQLLYFKALSYVHNKDDALDAIQETAYHAYVAIKSVRKPEYFSTWLVRILIRECYKLLRQNSRIIPYEEEALMQKMDYLEHNCVDRIAIRDAIAILDIRYQSALILFYYRDLSIKDIALVMGKPVGTVKTYLRRGRKLLKKELERGYLFHEKLS